jgi:hypothetical protein
VKTDRKHAWHGDMPLIEIVRNITNDEAKKNLGFGKDSEVFHIVCRKKWSDNKATEENSK